MKHLGIFQIAALLVGIVTAQDRDFTKITTNVPQDVSVVKLPPDCPSGGHKPKTMFTIEPSDDDTVYISTYPADLVTARKKGDDRLELVWNNDVAKDSSEGGVKIFFPASQLTSVSTAADAHAQILDGFTSVNQLSCSSDSELQAVFTTLDDSIKVKLSVSSDGTAKIVSNAPFGDVSVSSDGRLSLEAPSIQEVKVSSDGTAEVHGDVGYADISSDGKVTIDGDISNGGRVSSDGKLTVYGSVNGSFRVSSDAKLNVGGELVGDVNASSDAKVNAPNCNTVTTHSDAKCHVDDSISGSVEVNVETLPFTRTGRERCGWNSVGSAGAWCGAVVGLVAAFVGYFAWRCWCRNKNRDAYPAVPPPLEVQKGGDVSAVAYQVDHVEKQAPEQPPVEAEAIAYEVDPKETKPVDVEKV